MTADLQAPAGDPVHGGTRRQLLAAAAGGVVLAAMPARSIAGPTGQENAARTTPVALVLIDFQRSNAAASFKPYTFDQVVRQAAKVASAVRATGGLVVHTRVLEDEMLQLPADKPLPAGKPSSDGATLTEALSARPGDVTVTKRQWGAFYGTDLEQQLRRHGARTLLIAGVATEVGVESTAREAYDEATP